MQQWELTNLLYSHTFVEIELNNFFPNKINYVVLIFRKNNFYSLILLQISNSEENDTRHDNCCLTFN